MRKYILLGNIPTLNNFKKCITLTEPLKQLTNVLGSYMYLFYVKRLLNGFLQINTILKFIHLYKQSTIYIYKAE